MYMNKYMKIYLKNKEPSYFKYWGVYNLYGWAILQKLPDKKLNDFKWIEETSQFNEEFIEIYNEDSDIGYITEADVQHPEKVFELYNDLPCVIN